MSYIQRKNPHEDRQSKSETGLSKNSFILSILFWVNPKKNSKQLRCLCAKTAVFQGEKRIYIICRIKEFYDSILLGLISLASPASVRPPPTRCPPSPPVSPHAPTATAFAAKKSRHLEARWFSCSTSATSPMSSVRNEPVSSCLGGGGGGRGERQGERERERERETEGHRQDGRVVGFRGRYLCLNSLLYLVYSDHTQ